MNDLEKAREIINEVDAEMAKLFEKRMAASKMIAGYKMQNGLSIFDPAREKEVIRKASAVIEDDEIRAYYVNFLRNTMDVSKNYQRKIIEGMKVAYCGTEGAYAHIATCKLFPTAKKIAYKDFPSAYAAVESGECDVAVLPTENSYNGEVGQVTDLLFSGELYINNMFDLAVSHDLLGTPDSKIEDITDVVSHSQALGQCADYIRKNDFTPHEYTNTALAAKHVAEKGDKTLAAIASAEAAEIFGLKVLARNINASRSNTTRFAVLSRSQCKMTKGKMDAHSVLLFTVKNEAGALAKALEIIGEYGFNMKTLRSRPMKELLWQYYFYIEIEGNIHSEMGKEMLSRLDAYCDRIKLTGTFNKID
ncbi:MAG: chorismate mutase [Christensenellaceae bacterium]|nr:chorismate mutase [Christensenellaceae bacterium]